MGVLLLGTACPGVPRPLEAPQVELRDVSLAEDPNRSLLFSWNVTNPNSRTVSVRAVDWEVSVGGKARARGRVSLEALVGPRASLELVAKAPLGPGLWEGLLAEASRGSARAHGIVHFFSTAGDRGSMFEWVGELAQGSNSKRRLSPAPSEE
ncbi:MAG: hypothetical protein HY698_07620 [Deltaproteobacteria bacterium]|nr:hypothetical protein [Deltaproteobacteria bacterium]